MLTAVLMPYIGRFAPSPTGPLHFGSLLAALASYLDARANQGQWLLRIEDLDPPREMPGATGMILFCLEKFGFEWNGSVVRQSDRSEIYLDHLQTLLKNNQAYRCNCSRQQIKQRTGSSLYDRFCYSHPPAKTELCAMRCLCNAYVPFQDRILGQQQFPEYADDFVIHRRDGLFAYQLAVTVDDAEQSISHIVRGSDLLDSTPKQLHLQRLFNYPQPLYAHIPVATNSQGQKLSKQTFARPLNQSDPVPQLWQALQFLGQQPEPEIIYSPVSELLQWATEHWKIERIPASTAIEWKEAN